MDGLFLLRLLGTKRLLSIRRNYCRALPALRGYVVTAVFWSLLEEGFFDRLIEAGRVSLDEYANQRGLDGGVLHALCGYLEGTGVVALEGGECRLGPEGHAMLASPHGIYELVRGYRPLFEEIGGLLAGRRKYGADVTKDGGWVARGTGRLGGQFPFPIIAEVVKRRGYENILDLKCNDASLLMVLADEGAQRCFGLDDDPSAIACALSRISAARLADHIEVWHGDLFNTEDLAARCFDIDLIIAFDVFHEHLSCGVQPIIGFIEKLRVLFPRAHLLIAEFCRLPTQKLRSASKPFLEHELIHGLTGQRILSEPEWEELIAATPYQLLEKRVFSLIGHGYFLLG